jgi:hypothetical protein
MFYLVKGTSTGNLLLFNHKAESDPEAVFISLLVNKLTRDPVYSIREWGIDHVKNCSIFQSEDQDEVVSHAAMLAL